MRTPRPSSLKERCLAALDPVESGKGECKHAEFWLAGAALRNRKWTEDALADLSEAVKLCAIILVEEYGAREYEGKV